MRLKLMEDLIEQYEEYNNHFFSASELIRLEKRWSVSNEERCRYNRELESMMASVLRNETDSDLRIYVYSVDFHGVDLCFPQNKIVNWIQEGF